MHGQPWLPRLAPAAIFSGLGTTLILSSVSRPTSAMITLPDSGSTVSLKGLRKPLALSCGEASVGVRSGGTGRSMLEEGVFSSVREKNIKTANASSQRGIGRLEKAVELSVSQAGVLIILIILLYTSIVQR